MDNVFADSGVGKQTRRIIDSYGNEMAKFLDDAIERLDFCKDQLTSARKFPALVGAGLRKGRRRGRLTRVFF